MATRGTKTTLIAGACALAVLAGTVAVYWDDITIEWSIRQLHSMDDATREASAKSLTEFGVRVMPGLLAELKNVERGREDIDGDLDVSFWLSPLALDLAKPLRLLPFESGFLRTVSLIGPDALPPTIRAVDRSEGRLAGVLVAAIWLCRLFRELGDSPQDQLSTSAGESAARIAEAEARIAEAAARIFASAPRRWSELLPTPILQKLCDDPTEPAEVRTAASEMLEKLKTKQAAAKAE